MKIFFLILVLFSCNSFAFDKNKYCITYVHPGHEIVSSPFGCNSYTGDDFSILNLKKIHLHMTPEKCDNGFQTSHTKPSFSSLKRGKLKVFEVERVCKFKG
jgi:hypothetical protein